MRLISLRKFNSNPTEWKEPISLTLNKGGETIVLGTFIPTGYSEQPRTEPDVKRKSTHDILSRVAKQ